MSARRTRAAVAIASFLALEPAPPAAAQMFLPSAREAAGAHALGTESLAGHRGTGAGTAVAACAVLPEVRASVLWAKAVRSRAAALLRWDALQADAGSLGAWTLGMCAVPVERVAIEGEITWARLTAVGWEGEPSRASGLAGRVRLTTSERGGATGGWCGIDLRSVAELVPRPRAMTLGAWWGTGDRPFCSLACTLVPASGIGGATSLEIPVTPSMRVEAAASSFPAALVVGLRYRREVLAVEVARTLNSVLGPGMRLAFSWGRP